MTRRCICGHDEDDHDKDEDCVHCWCGEFTPDNSEPEEPGYVFD